ncbi:MAG: WD40 repeat domain-containing protein [Gemmataceae bacterium]
MTRGSQIGLCLGLTLWTTVAGWSQTLKTTFRGYKVGYTPTATMTVLFSPDGKTIASLRGDEAVQLWEVTTGKLRAILKGHAREVNSVAFSPDGKTLASSSDDQTIKLWNPKTGKVQTVLKFDQWEQTPTGVCFSPNGRWLARIATTIGVPGFSPGQEVCVWDVKTHQRKANFKMPDGKAICVSFSPDGKMLTALSPNGTFTFWETETLMHRRKIKLPSTASHSASVCYNPSGRTLAVIDDHQNDVFNRKDNISLLNPLTGRLLRTIPGHTGKAHFSSPIHSAVVCFSPDEKTLASTNYSGTAKLWNVTTGKLKGTIRGPGGWVTSLQFSHDGKRLLVASQVGAFDLWEISKPK